MTLYHVVAKKLDGSGEVVYLGRNLYFAEAFDVMVRAKIDLLYGSGLFSVSMITSTENVPRKASLDEDHGAR